MAGGTKHLKAPVTLSRKTFCHKLNNVFHFALEKDCQCGLKIEHNNPGTTIEKLHRAQIEVLRLASLMPNDGTNVIHYLIKAMNSQQF